MFRAQETERWAGPRFEYKFLRHTFATADIGDFTKLGTQGWEYVGATLGDDKRYIFRRRATA